MVSTRDVDLLARALEVDRALSAGQVARRYDLDVCRLGKPFILVEAFTSATYGSQNYQRVAFVTLERKVSRLNAASLRHLAGVAEMRRYLNAPPEAWQNDAAARHAVEVPDALWLTPEGGIAIEYDAGSYGRARITTKALAYRRYAGQVWASPSRKHVRHLTTLLPMLDVATSPFYAPWY